MRSSAKGLYASVERTGAWRLLPPALGGVATIFAFHRVRRNDQDVVDPSFYVTESFLEAALRYVVDRGYDVVSLDTLCDRLRQPADRPPMVVFTFDDGYRDNATLAAPIFVRHGLPWTLYLTTGFLDRTCSYWWGALERVIGTRDAIDVELPGFRARLPASTAHEKRGVSRKISFLARSHGEELSRFLESRYGVSGTKLLDEEAMSWREACELVAGGNVTIGAHTITHRPLSLLSDGEALEEIRGSRVRICEMMGIEARHFALPFGSPDTVLDAHSRLAEQCGFRSSVATSPTNVYASQLGGLHALPRITICGEDERLSRIGWHLSGMSGLMKERTRHPLIASWLSARERPSSTGSCPPATKAARPLE